MFIALPEKAIGAQTMPNVGVLSHSVFAKRHCGWNIKGRGPPRAPSPLQQEHVFQRHDVFTLTKVLTGRWRSRCWWRSVWARSRSEDYILDAGGENW